MSRSDPAAVVALAGRRIDPADSEQPRFPLHRVPSVRRRLAEVLRARRPHWLVSSAACGADLIALGLAAQLRMRARVVLPFAPDRFRTSSVTDRPGEWGSEFDLAVARARATKDLVVLEAAGEGSAAYAAANAAILDQAEALSLPFGTPPAAIIVWDGHSRGPRDLTESFASLARGRGLEVIEVPTLPTERTEE